MEGCDFLDVGQLGGEPAGLLHRRFAVTVLAVTVLAVTVLAVTVLAVTVLAVAAARCPCRHGRGPLGFADPL
ncbi:hypothetical protein ACU635_31245 [[Actinomadura] parvosata]|uniref:hypothetical protein n=1 Tax=[Actinomadura] parvosata TaxID=1955412 RepID=UPI00406C0695